MCNGCLCVNYFKPSLICTQTNNLSLVEIVRKARFRRIIGFNRAARYSSRVRTGCPLICSNTALHWNEFLLFKNSLSYPASITSTREISDPPITAETTGRTTSWIATNQSVLRITQSWFVGFARIDNDWCERSQHRHVSAFFMKRFDVIHCQRHDHQTKQSEQNSVHSF